MNIVRLLFITMFFSSCQEREVKASDSKESDSEISSEVALIGTWQSEVEDGEWGASYSVHKYFSDGRVEGTAYMVDSGEQIDWAGEYRIQDNIIFRTIEGATHEITFRIEDDLLYGEVLGEKVTFKRKTEQGVGE
jgi:hypothetical protein